MTLWFCDTKIIGSPYDFDLKIHRVPPMIFHIKKLNFMKNILRYSLWNPIGLIFKPPNSKRATLKGGLAGVYRIDIRSSITLQLLNTLQIFLEYTGEEWWLFYFLNTLIYGRGIPCRTGREDHLHPKNTQKWKILFLPSNANMVFVSV